MNERKDDTRLFYGGNHRQGLVLVRGEWLLQENVVSRLSRGNRGRMMQVVRQADIYVIQVVACEQVAVLRVARIWRDLKAVTEQVPPLRRRIRHCHHGNTARQLRIARQVSLFRNPTTTDDANSLHHSPSFT